MAISHASAALNTATQIMLPHQDEKHSDDEMKVTTSLFQKAIHLQPVKAPSPTECHSKVSAIAQEMLDSNIAKIFKS
jgi:hypothetical protein